MHFYGKHDTGDGSWCITAQPGSHPWGLHLTIKIPYICPCFFIEQSTDAVLDRIATVLGKWRPISELR